MILAFRTFALRQFVGDKWSMSIRRLLFIVVCFLLGATHNAMGQSSVYGYGPYVNSVPLPVENGYVDAVNGNLHLEIPITAAGCAYRPDKLAANQYSKLKWRLALRISGLRPDESYYRPRLM
jgi:hypothetical protein